MTVDPTEPWFPCEEWAKVFPHKTDPDIVAHINQGPSSGVPLRLAIAAQVMAGMMQNCEADRKTNVRKALKSADVMIAAFNEEK